MALAYIDYSAQELSIAAALSQDPELLKAVESGDPYLAFAARAGLVPDGATKAHPPEAERDICKVALLGMNYGLGVRSLAAGTGLSPVHAQLSAQAAQTDLRRVRAVVGAGDRHRVTARRDLHAIRLAGRRRRGHQGDHAQEFPGTGPRRRGVAGRLQLIVEDGIRLCAPIHDAVLVEAPADEIDAVVERTRRHMAQASRDVLGGFEIGTDAKIVRYPERYMERRGRRIWDAMMAFKEASMVNSLRLYWAPLRRYCRLLLERLT